MRPAPEVLVPARVRGRLDAVLPDRLTDWWRRTFAGVTPKERWGYRLWTLVGLVIAIPELGAAVWDNGPWPTISGTTGHLEDIWKPTAIFVVALIVFAAGRALGYGAPRDPAEAPGVEPARANDWWPWIYFGVAVVGTAVAGFVVAKTVDGGKEAQFVVGYVIYGLIGFFFLLVPALFGWALARFAGRDVVPFPPIFRTVADLEKRVPLIALILLTGLVILLIHLALYPWPDISHQHPTPDSV
jgi:hypothetical protein